MSRKIVVASALLITPVLLTACSGGLSLDKATVEQKISEGYQQQKNVKPGSVSCPGNLKGKVNTEMTCTMTVGGKKMDVKVVVTKVEGNQIYFNWETKN